MTRLFLAALLLASPAFSATIITESRLAGNLYDLDPGEYTTRSTTFNTLGSVTTACGAPADGRRAIIKCASDAVPDGRFGENGGPWVDSADIGEIERTVHFGQKIRAIGFGVSDANDQRDSWWNFTVNGVTASIAPRLNDEGEAAVWFTVLFDEPVDSAHFAFSTRPGDGYGIMAPTAVPIPLPAAVLAMPAAFGGLAGRAVAARRSRSGTRGVGPG